MSRYSFITKEFEIHKGTGQLTPIPKNSINNDDERIIKDGNIIYVYHGKKNMYIGQTKNFEYRHKQHVRESNKRYVNGSYMEVMINFGRLINQGSLDDIEKQLITYVTADYEGSRSMNIDNSTSGNLSPSYGLSDEVYFEIIKPLWEKLYHKKYVKHENLSEIQKSILFKYSPFSSLPSDKVNIINEIANKNGNYLIRGLAGTGKTVVLTNLAALIHEKHKNASIGIVVKSNWRKNGQKIFKAYGVKNIHVLSAYQLISQKQHFDYILVDESHRLRRYYSKGDHNTQDIFKKASGEYDENTNELKLLGELTDNLTLLYDPTQTIRPNDIPKNDFEKYVYTHNFQTFTLEKEYRINADEHSNFTSEDFINGIQSFLQIDNQPFNKGLFQEYKNEPEPQFNSYFGVVDSISELFDYLDYKEAYHPGTQNRVMGGYTREWESHKPKNKKIKEYVFDWIEDAENNKQWQWNSTSENWINKKNSRKEIGSIHAVQGIDLNYTGVIISKDITVTDDGKIVAIKENYMDRNGKYKKEDFDEEGFNNFIKNIYYVLLTRAIDGIRVYFEDEKLRDYFMKYMNI
ncbi:DNA/RNA helicase domain-containing protein [Lactobacillaceae bacterium Melli_B4]